MIFAFGFIAGLILAAIVWFLGFKFFDRVETGIGEGLRFIARFALAVVTLGLGITTALSWFAGKLLVVSALGQFTLTFFATFVLGVALYFEVRYGKLSRIFGKR